MKQLTNTQGICFSGSYENRSINLGTNERTNVRKNEITNESTNKHKNERTNERNYKPTNERT